MEENKNLTEQESNSGRVAGYVDLLAEGIFYWNTNYAHSNNMETMQDYLENYLPQNCEIIEDDGTYAEVVQNGVKIGIHASGNGDFCSHKVEFEKVEE